MPRMRILTANEQELFDKPPLFDHRDRKKLFDFPKSLLAVAATMRNSDHQIGFLASCGYFRATRRFFATVDFVIQRHIQVPSAYRLSDLIRTGLHDRKAELIALMNSQLPAEARNLLDDLFTAPDDQNRYRLTLLKKLSQSTSPSRIKEAVADLEVLSELHNELSNILSQLDLGIAGIRYFAGSVMRSEVFQIQRPDQNDRYIHATAFVAHQFYRCQDNMLDLWLSVMASFKSAAAREYQDALVQDRKAQQRQIEVVVDGL